MNKKGTNSGWIVAIVAILVIFVGIVGWRLADKKANSVDYSKYDINSYIEASDDNGQIADHIKGDKNAPVLIFEYADYQCSACAGMNSRVNKLLEEYGGKLAIVYRNFLLNYHQNATAAASAAEAAGLQGYWKEYADKLFANQSTWSEASGDSRTSMFVDLFNNVTNGQGDVQKFVSDMNSSNVKAKLDFDAGLSKGLEIPGTPSFYLDGELIQLNNISTEDDFMNLFRGKIDAKLNQNS